MKVLFVHNNFPSQFKHLAPELVRRGVNVTSISLSPVHIGGVTSYTYTPNRDSSKLIHPWLMDLEPKIIRGESCLRLALELKQKGYYPDCIVAHPGWGEALFLKDVWPNSKFGLYCEFYYHHEGYDVGFEDHPSVKDETLKSRFKIKNINNDLNIQIADAGISPTYWQASTFPKSFRDKITVVHDGIDTDIVCPDISTQITLSNGIRLSKNDEVITFVNRNLEPYRGYHIFMRSLPTILDKSPIAKIIIVGGDGVSYGSNPPEGSTWKSYYLNEILPQLSDGQRERIFFLGNVSYDSYLAILRVSSVHVYLTYPFVLGWSMLEAMSAGCCVVGSSTPPVTEVIEDGRNGRLVNFFEPNSLAEAVLNLLGNKDERELLGMAARETILAHYDLKRICLPKQISWFESLAKL